MSKDTPKLPGQKPRPFLLPAQVRRLVDARKDGATFDELARRFQVSTTFVRKAIQDAEGKS